MNEKLQILKMVEAGQITVDEAAKLLEALGEENELVISEHDDSDKKKANAKWLRVRVIDPSDNMKVNINIPVALVDIGLKIGSKYNKELESSLSGIDLTEVIKLIKEGAEGKIVDIESSEGERVEISVE